MPLSRPRRLAPLLLATALPFVAAAQDNPLARYPQPPQGLVNGIWNGIDLERRSGCASAQNNGSHGTYAQFNVATNALGDFSITQTGITGLNCTYSGKYAVIEGLLGVQGNYSCTDGKQGTFRTRRVDVTGMVLTAQMDIQLGGTETCTIDGLLSMARFYP
jgi:hypothetical protein